MYSEEISIPVDLGILQVLCRFTLLCVAYEAIEVEIYFSLLPFEYLGVSHKRFSLFNYTVVVFLYFGIRGIRVFVTPKTRILASPKSDCIPS